MVSQLYWDYIVRTLPGGAAAIYVYDEVGDEVGEFIADTRDEALELAEDAALKAGAVLSKLGAALANATLDLIRGLGSAILDGLDATFDAAAAKLEGREPAVISGLTVATVGFLTAVFLYNAAKSGRV